MMHEFLLFPINRLVNWFFFLFPLSSFGLFCYWYILIVIHHIFQFQVCKFLEVSKLSFSQEFGPKLKEDYVMVKHSSRTTKEEAYTRCCLCQWSGCCNNKWKKVNTLDSIGISTKIESSVYFLQLWRFGQYFIVSHKVDKLMSVFVFLFFFFWVNSFC